MDTEQQNLDKQMQERFAQLPKVVQQAITSADVQKHLRELADAHKLHLDQWAILENEVMLALLGFEPVEALASNIEKEVHVDASTAQSLARDISQIVFIPVRKQLEAELQHPDSVTAHDTTAQTAPQAAATSTPAQFAGPAQTTPQPVVTQVPAPMAISESTAATVQPTPEPIPAQAAVPAPVAPATPPATPVEGKVERAPLSQSYLASQPSHERKAIEGDPYREQLI
jgi:hypothetical protein